MTFIFSLLISIFLPLHSQSALSFDDLFFSQLSRSKKFKHNRDSVQSKKPKKAPPKQFNKTIAKSNCTAELVIENVISSATLDSLEKALKATQQKKCSSLLLLINTPGGLLLSTRKIVEVILDSPVPILCLVHPAGAHAGSAGAIILQACHVNGAVQATNIGAATPILGSGGKASEDLRKKMVNDATSWLDSLTGLRKRNKKFGREIVTEAKAVSGKEAQKIKAIDFYGHSKEEFLEFAHGKKVLLANNTPHFVQVGSLESIPLGMRHHLVSFVTDPEIAYLMFTGSLLLLYFELTHPGMVVPGVIGAMGLVLSLTGMHKLNFEWGGLILMLIGLIFMVLEAFTAVGFGFLGLGGAVSFVIGSFFLFDPNQMGGVSLPYSTIIFVSLFFISISFGIAYLAFTALRKKRISEKNWIGSIAELVKIDSHGGLLEIQGELWKCKFKDPLEVGDSVKIVGYDRMVFDVEKAEQGARDD